MPPKDYVGVILFGRRKGNRPEPLDRWRLASEDKTVRDRLEGVLNSGRFRVLLDSADSVQLEMVQWDQSGVIHHCDGAVILSPAERIGTPCGCPLEIEKRKNCAANGLGPQPGVRVEFRIADCPEVGTFAFRSSSWAFFGAAVALKNELAGRGGRVLCNLFIEAVELRSTGGAFLTHFQPLIAAVESR
ncbi:hypothetical protein [Streptomyces sp. NPDC057623]|uniref:recombination directionality factor n=1 Tax=Streptomyces sp. NPDC057623 TaxID=3346187 RepID=UPI0036BEBF3A